ncbi:MAG: hypothetical protein GF383_01530 [Candidatus Lokiarchaeota archaeon]|nr:hypothetical protein [Candidatus Lokiarchaeota archaeon]MBD3337962.1 hypothetical protein [Candidatus Lokiarchaeota archaeon]
MCRMFFQCAKKPFTVEYGILKKFISSCHWKYFRKYNLLGHHNLGWGYSYLSEEDQRLYVKRDLTPIYKAHWKDLISLRTKFLLIHARKSYPWKKDPNNIHPIDIREKYLMTHNGTIVNSSVPLLKDPKLEQIKKSTNLDTRKYLCYVIDELKQRLVLKSALESVFETLELGIGANAFLFNTKECNVIKRQNNRFNGRHRTLFIAKYNEGYLVSTSPLTNNPLEIPNNSLIKIDLDTLQLKVNKLEVV